MKSILTLLVLFVFSSADAQVASQTKSSTSDVFAKLIRQDQLKRHATILASNSNEGRETGQPGIKKAANYITSILKGFGASPGGTLKNNTSSYLQNFVYYKESLKEHFFIVREDTMLPAKDYFINVSTNPMTNPIDENSIMFLGYGIDSDNYNDFKGVNIRNKTILILAGEPVTKAGKSLITNTMTKSEWTQNYLLKLQAAKRYGAKMVFIVDDSKASFKNKTSKRWILGSGLQPDKNLLSNCFITTACAKKMLGRKFRKVAKCKNKILKRGKPRHFKAKTNFGFNVNIKRSFLKGDNILTIIEGSDSILKEEYVFITAHYDHLGKRGDDIFNGADDNASGSAALLEITHAIQKAKEANLNPKRSIVVMWVAGEEKGLLGSNHYVEYPIYPLENTVADVNIDMIGRMDKYHKNNPNYIYSIGANMLSSSLDSIVRVVNKNHVQLELDYKFNSKDDPNRYYYRSDHYNFAKNDIPSVFFFDGGHEDYHRPSDTVEKLNFKMMSKVAKLAFHTIWEIANRPNRLKLDRP